MGIYDFTTITPLAEYEADQTLATSTKYALVDASNYAVTITVAAASNARIEHFIKKVDSSSHSIKVQADGDDTIDGESYIELKYQYDYIHIISDGGTEWHIIGGGIVKIEEVLASSLTEQEATNDNLSSVIDELTKLRKKVDKWAASEYSDYAGDVEDD